MVLSIFSLIFILREIDDKSLRVLVRIQHMESFDYTIADAEITRSPEAKPDRLKGLFIPSGALGNPNINRNSIRGCMTSKNFNTLLRLDAAIFSLHQRLMWILIICRRKQSFLDDVLDIVAAQFPRGSLIACIPVAGISNFHDRTAAKCRHENVNRVRARFSRSLFVSCNDSEENYDFMYVPKSISS